MSTSLSDPVRLATDLARGVLAGTRTPLVAGVPEPGAGPPVVSVLDGRHPLEVLWGLRAPSTWRALVVVATGSVVAAADGSGGTRVVAASVTSRSGPDRSLVLDERGRALLEPSVVEGLVPDACRRALGRPAAPPVEPVSLWWAREWLDEVRSLVRAGPTPPPVAEVAACHPAVAPEEVAAPGPELLPWLVQRGRDHAHLTGWDGVRRSVASGIVASASCPPALAAWFDAGSFSRFESAVRPQPLDRVAELRRLLDPAGADLVAGALGAWVVDGDR